MDVVKAHHVAAILTGVGGYGGQLAAVFHNYALLAERIPYGFEGAINILDATVVVLKQLLSLVKDEAEGGKFFNLDGLTYVQLLAQESANTLARIEPLIADACLEREHRNANRKQRKRAAKKSVVAVDPLSMKLDEKDFSDKVLLAKWGWANDEIGNYMERLYELQLHLLLIFEVVTVGALSKDLTSGKVDIQSIVTHHNHINRTADLIGIKRPQGRACNKWRSRSSNSSDSNSSSDSSDSDASSIARKPKKKPLVCGPPPPPPTLIVRGGPGPVFPRPPGSSAPFLPAAPPTTKMNLVVKDGALDLTSIDRPNPPAYHENRPSDSPPSALGIPKPILVQSGPSAASTLTEKASDTATYRDEKSELKAENERSNAKQIAVHGTSEGNFFKAPTSSLGFKFKSFFRSKESLAVEMRTVLADSESRLLAFVVHRHELRQVPHSAFHTLEATHMRTILSQLKGSEWYKTFSNLDTYENSSISRLLHPWIDGNVHERELVVLKVVGKSRFDAWMCLIGDLLKNRPFTSASNGRVLLAIVREKSVNRKPLKDTWHSPPPPPPGAFLPVSVRPSIQAPPTFPLTTSGTIVSDLQCPAPPMSPSWVVGPPPPPPSSSPRGPPPPPPGRYSSPRLSDLTSVTEYDAKTVLTSYGEFTLRVSESPEPGVPVTWARVTVTQEFNDKDVVLQRVSQFQRTGRSIIEIKLRLSEHQNAQMTRLMEGVIKRVEWDSRFEWTWAEISVYKNGIEITDSILNGSGIAGSVMHLIAKRSLKPNFKALDVYNTLMQPPPPPPPRLPPMETPEIVMRCSTPKKKSRYVDSSSDSDSDSTSWTSDSSVGEVRRRLRRYRAKKVKKSSRGKYRYGSDSDSDDEEEDVIKIKLQMKRGDDIVKILLAMWTAEAGDKGKGKELVT